MVKVTNNKAGFTLVELAIVIVVIGFLVAGIAAGTNMIKQAELRSFIVDLKSFQTAYHNFVGRYNKVPGDMDVASSYFPTCAVTPANCNGDGDGLIEHGVTSAANESLKAWRQLDLADMIGVGIQQIPDTTTGTLAIGTETPSSKKSGIGYMMASGGANISAGGAIVSPFDNSARVVYIGRGGVAAEGLIVGALTAEQAFNLDQKLDDALVSGSNFQGATSGTFRAIDGSGAAANACANADVYAIANTTESCVPGLAFN